MISRTLRLGALLAVGLVQPAAAETWWPLDTGLQQDYRAAYEALLADPDDPARLAAFANEASRIGNYEAAIGALEAILIQNPGLNQVRVELGVMYYRVRAHEVSRYHLNRALESGTLPLAVAERARSFLDTNEDRLAGTSISGYLSAGLRYDSNPTFAANADTIFSFDDFIGTVNVANPNDDDADWAGFLQGAVLWREDLGNQYGESWDTRAVAYWRWQFDEREVNVGYNRLTTGPRIAVLPGTLDNAWFHPYALATLSFVEHDFANATGGGGATLSKRFGTWLTVTLDGNARWRGSSDEDHEGLLAEGRVGLSMALTEDLLVGFGARVQTTKAEADYRSSTAWGLYGSLHLRYDAPFGLTDYPWELSIQGDYRRVDYHGVNPAVGAGLERDDHDARAVIRNTIGLSSSWFVYAEGGVQDIGSTIPNYRTDNKFVALGATWRF